VTTLKRTAALPDIPTMDEAGLPGFEATTWHGLVAPAGTPPDIVGTLHRAVVETLKDAGVQQKLAALGVDIAPDSPDEFAAYINAEIPKWAAVIKASGAKVE
jgi:tripartite-type tricarboxylate transporter receptor subunit TctC